MMSFQSNRSRKTLLDELFPDGNGLGQTVYFGDIPMKIIGVVDLMKGPWLKDSRPDNVSTAAFY